MTASPLVQSLMEHPDYLVPIRVEQYQHMLETGILPEGAPLELIDGVLVRKDRRDGEGGIMTVGERHRLVVDRLMELLVSLCRGHGCRVSIQQPVRLSQVDMPEPDLSVLLGPIKTARQEHPLPQDLVLVIEVAHSSLAFDQNTKLAKYAAAGISEVWIVNLVDDVIEVYREPASEDGKYAIQDKHQSGDVCSLTLPDGTMVEIAVNEILS